MRKITWLSIVLILIILIGVFGPFTTGIYFAKEYPKVIRFYNENETVVLTLKDYRRGWFSSNAILTVTILPSPWIKNLNVNTFPLPQTFTAYQHIQHGPIFYHHTGFNTLFGLALIENRWQVTEEFKNFFKQLGFVRGPTNFKDNEIMTLTGRFITYVNIEDFAAVKDNQQFKIHHLFGKTAIDPDKRKLQGKITIDAISMITPETTATVSDIKCDYDFHQILQSLWIGKDSITIAKIHIQDKDSIFSMKDIDIHGQSHEEEGLLDASRQVSVAEFVGDTKGKIQSMGPFNFKISLNKINAQAVNNLLKAYQETSERGELYTSQLQQKIISIAPSLISTNSNIILDGLSFKTPNGDLNLTAKIDWPQKTGDQLFEVIQNSHAEANLHISKKLVEQLIQLAVNPTVMKPRDPENLTDMPVTPSVTPNYGTEALPTPVSSSNSEVPEKIHAQIKDWLNAGYIEQDADNYIVKIERKEGQVTINGKPI